VTDDGFGIENRMVVVGLNELGKTIYAIELLGKLFENQCNLWLKNNLTL
jgi:hypothetical protein